MFVVLDTAVVLIGVASKDVVVFVVDVVVVVFVVVRVNASQTITRPVVVGKNVNT